MNRNNRELLVNCLFLHTPLVYCYAMFECGKPKTQKD